jgi:hypothetical protein
LRHYAKEPHVERRPPRQRGGHGKVELLEYLEIHLVDGSDLVVAAQARWCAAVLDAVDDLDVRRVVGDRVG